MPCLDGKAQRELLAGVDLVLGDERAKTAAATERATNAESFAKRLQDEQRRTNIEYGLIGGAVGAAITALISTIFLTKQ